MRLFVAVGVNAEVTAKLSDIQQQLARLPTDIHWVGPEQYHITVKFIGPAAEEQLTEIGRRVDKAAAQTPTFELSIPGLSRIEAHGQVRIIAAEILSPDQRLHRLHRLIDQELGGMGFALDMRPLRPHLTLGRVRSNHSLNKLLRRLEHFGPDRIDPIGPWPADEVILMESTLTPEGAVYRCLHRAALALTTAQPGSVMQD